jgi:hypothetical protein
VSAFDELAAQWEEMAERFESLAMDVCRAQAERFVEIEAMVAPHRSGALARSVRIDSIGGGGSAASATVGPHKVYAEIQNDGGTIHAHGGEVWKTVNGKSRMYRHSLHWAGGFAMHVTIKGKGYVQRAQGAAAGPLTQIAEQILAFTLGT